MNDVHVNRMERNRKFHNFKLILDIAVIVKRTLFNLISENSERQKTIKIEFEWILLKIIKFLTFILQFFVGQF